jgi:V/A-type H+-transporting ATPase subunit E
MNGIEKITARINADAAQEIESVTTRAEEQIKSINENYEYVAQQAYFTVMSNGKAAAQTRLERLASADTMNGKKALLETKQQVLDETFAKALDRLCQLPEDQYCALLVKLAVEGSTTGKEELVFSAPDRARYGKKVVVAANEALEAAGKTAGLTLSEQSRDIRGGLFIKNGAIENNCAFETIIRLLREQLAGETAKVLFE